MAISGGLAFSAKSLLTDGVETLAREPGTFFGKMGVWLPGGFYSVTAIQWTTILCFAISGVFFVWQNAGTFGDLSQRGRMRVLFEAGVYSCALLCSWFCAAKVWGFRGAFGFATVFWVARSWMDRDVDLFRRMLLQYSVVFASWAVLVMVVGVVALVARSVFDRRLFLDIAFTYVPFVAALWAFIGRTVFELAISLRWGWPPVSVHRAA